MILDQLLLKVKALVIGHGVSNPNIHYWLNTISAASREYFMSFFGETLEDNENNQEGIIKMSIELAALLVGFALFLTQGNPDDRDRDEQK